MVNNYYIGDIHHNKTIKKDAYTEKLVLYSDDKYNYLDLINDINYTTDNDPAIISPKIVIEKKENNKIVEICAILVSEISAIQIDDVKRFNRREV